MMEVITQQELERLLRESEQIANDWSAYLRFCRNRSAIRERFLPDEAPN